MAANLPRFLYSGLFKYLAMALDAIEERVSAVEANGGGSGGGGGTPAFVRKDFTYGSATRPNATSVMWVGPTKPLNATDADFYVPSAPPIIL